MEKVDYAGVQPCGHVHPPKDRNENLRQYQPCSDLLISKSRLPRLLVELNSTERKGWLARLIRMLLQAAAIVRFANTFLKAYKEKDFVLAVILIYADGSATRYALFQQKNSRVVCCCLFMNKLTGQAIVDLLQQNAFVLQQRS